MTSAPTHQSSAKTIWIVVGIVVFVILALIGTAVYLVYSATQRFAEEFESQFDGLYYSEDREHMSAIASSIDSYKDVSGYYPQAAAGPSDVAIDRQASWMVEIRDFVRHEEEFYHIEQYDPALPIDDPQNQAFATQQMYIYQAWEENRGDVTNWIGIGGVGVDSPEFPLSNPKAGFFGYSRRITPADIKDGRSNTMMIASSFRNCGSWSAAGDSTVRGLDPGDQPYVGAGRQFGNYSGAITAFADGSVQKISMSIDPSVFEAAATIAGGDTVDFTDPGFTDNY